MLETDPKGRTSCLLHDQTPWSFPTHNRKEFAPGPEAKGPLALAARGRTADLTQLFSVHLQVLASAGAQEEGEASSPLVQDREPGGFGFRCTLKEQPELPRLGGGREGWEGQEEEPLQSERRGGAW